MNMKNIGQLIINCITPIGLIAASNVVAPLYWINFPRNIFRNIKVTQVKNSFRNKIAVKEIHCIADGRKFKIILPNNERGHCESEIKNNGYCTHKYDEVLESGYWNGGSGDIGLAIFGLTGTIIASPLILLSKILFLPLEQVTDMKRNTYIFWLKVRNQIKELDLETYNMLNKFLRNT